MFGLSILKKREGQVARDCYKTVFMVSRKPAFYESLSVPDTIDGRFDLLLVHAYLVNQRLLDEVGREEEAEQFTQSLFDIMFADMDQALRESGIGDMGVPKHMKRMMLAYNGRMHAYGEAKTLKALQEALARNLYGTLDKAPAKALKGMAAYMRDSARLLQNQDFDDICAGQMEFAMIGEV